MIKGTLKLVKLKKTSDKLTRVLITNNGDMNILPLKYAVMVDHLVESGLVKDGKEITLKLS